MIVRSTSLILIFFFASAANAQLNVGDVVITEFFEQMFLLPNDGGPLQDIFDGPTSPRSVVVSGGEIFANSGNGIFRYDTTNNTANRFASTSGNGFFRDLTLDNNGDLVVVGADGLSRIDSITGQSQKLFTGGTFFNAMDAAIGNDGTIYIAEFFEGLGRVTSDGHFVPVGNFAANQFQDITFGDDGFLYALDTFDFEVSRIDPMTGSSSVIFSNDLASPEEIEFGTDGNLLLSTNDDLYRLDLTTNQLISLTNSPSLFGVQDFAVVGSVVPEPTIAPWVGVLLLTLGRRNRRA